MKRTLFTLTIMLAVAVNMRANPVDLTMARTAAQKFAEAKFAANRQTAELVYTGLEEAFYVFNIGDHNFVIIAADDAHRPVIGYSNESRFDANNIPPALTYYLEGVAMSINQLRDVGNAVATPKVAAEWESLLSRGELLSFNGGRGVEYLVQTQWDQSYPYNYFCPEDPAGSGGHTYVGCLATAMSQLVAFWKMPEHGYGSHCYYHQDYGEICADFENTYYDWDHIANKINANSPIEEIEAVALIGFHCGVTIDMGYGPDGSGGASGPIPGAMHQYYGYSQYNIQLRRNDFQTETWKGMVREQFDMGWPMYYGGCDDGCHAFICDGYDDNDMFHFNLGWGGSSDGWYLIDDAPYTHPADAMFNFVPAEIYDVTPSLPTSFSVTVPSETELHATLQWTNPTTSLNGSTLSSIQEVVVMRNNQVIQVLTDVTPGQTVVMEDNDIPYYGTFQYAVYVKANGRYGKHAYFYNVKIGPSCQWKIIMTSSDLQGWKGGFITAYDNAGHPVASCSMESSTMVVEQPELPLGLLSFGWTPPYGDTVNQMGIVIRDSQNNEMYSFSGSSAELNSGIFFETNNGCGNTMSCEVPTGLIAVDNGDDPILLTWDAASDPGYGYLVYRDGLLCRLVQSGTSFLDAQAVIGGHCYQVAVLCDGGQGEKSHMSCATEGPCYPPRNLGFEITSNHKVKLNWEAPVDTEELSGYYLYRKAENEDYHKIKAVNPNKITVTDNNSLPAGDYYYQLIAVYKDLDCLSAPANVQDEPNEFELLVHYDPSMGVEENVVDVEIVPNPTNGMVYIAGANMLEVEVYNIVGQSVATKKAEGEKMEMDLSHVPAGLYFVHVIDNNGGCSVRKLLKQ